MNINSVKKIFFRKRRELNMKKREKIKKRNLKENLKWFRRFKKSEIKIILIKIIILKKRKVMKLR